MTGPAGLAAAGHEAGSLPRPAIYAKALPRTEKAKLLAAMDENEVKSCQNCGLCRGRINTVFGEGDPDAPIMFVGEGPGQDEDMQGRPFVGRAGELLNRMISAMGYQREQVYIANVVKCRPPNNRTPGLEEVEACWPYLLRQIEVIRPKVLVALGGPASKRLLETTVGITRLRGTWGWFRHVEPQIPVMPTFHPAYLLRAYTQENRKRVWGDLQQVIEVVGKPADG